MPNGLFYLNSLDRSISNKCLVRLELPEFNANNVDPDQTPNYVASDLGLHCLKMSLFEALGINELRGLDTIGRFSAIL